MCDLVGHLGHVHRWATAHVAQRRAEPMEAREEAELFAQWPHDTGLMEWFRDGLAALVYALETAAPDLACWTFLPAPSPLAFWARRQAHETAIHRADAQSAGGAITAYPPLFAADGIDELLFGFVSRPRGRLRADPPRALHLQATDAGREWLVHIGPERVEVRGEAGDAECTVSGPASELYLMLWNRRPADGLALQGDTGLLEVWRDLVQIRWS
jgi:uncharacterized protein (TIGR03083 family)